MTPLAREALDYVTLLGSGTATVDDANDAALWRARSEAHEQAFREAVRVRRGVQAMLEARGAGVVTPFRPRQVAFSRRAFIAGGGAVAASVAGAAMMVRPPLDLWPSYAEFMADYRTAAGERRTITPWAGVKVEMNTRTSIDKAGGERIDLVVGEAFVTVAPSARLLVGAGDGEVRAAHASFNIRNVDGEICVSCVQGKLDVKQGRNRSDLVAGQELVFSPDHFGAARSTDPQQTAPWRSGLLVFRGEPLDAVIAELNRYRTGRIVLTDNSLARRPVSAVFHLDQMANAVTQVEQLVGVRSTNLPGGVVLIG